MMYKSLVLEKAFIHKPSKEGKKGTNARNLGTHGVLAISCKDTRHCACRLYEESSRATACGIS